MVLVDVMTVVVVVCGFLCCVGWFVRSSSTKRSFIVITLYIRARHLTLPFVPAGEQVLLNWKLGFQLCGCKGQETVFAWMSERWAHK